MATSFKTFLSYRNVVVLAVANLTVMLGYGMFSPMMPVYLYNVFGSTLFMVGLFTSIFGLMRAVLQPVMGRVSDRIGRKKMIVPALFSYSAIAYLYSTAKTGYDFLGYRAGQGVASSTLWPASDALVADTIPTKQRARALGVMSMAYQVGDVAGFGLGALVAGFMGFVEVFYICALIAFVGALTSLLFLKEPRLGATEQLAAKGVLKSVIPNDDPPNGAATSEQISNEIGVESSLSDHRRILACVGAMNFTLQLGFSMLEMLLSIIIVDVYSGTFIDMAIIYIAFGLVGAVAAIIGGSIAEKYGKRKLLLIGTIAGMGFWFCLLITNSLLSLAAVMSIFVFIIGVSGPAVMALVAELTPPGKRGRNYGYIGMTNDAGLVFGPIFGGLLLDYFRNSMGLTLLGAMQTLFLVNVIFAGIAAEVTLIGVREPSARF
jgi:DHA1 family multidrug resistance protein-like MFS transporter